MSRTGTNTTPTMMGELKVTILGALALTIAGLSAGAFTVINHQMKLSEQALAQEELLITRSEIDTLREQIKLSRLAQPEFERLRARGVVGALKKTQLADRFEQLVSDHSAGVRAFSLGALQPLPPTDLPLFDLALGRHQLTFRANVPHEIHLLALLDRIANGLDGLTLLNQCTIKLQGGSNPSGQQSRLDESSMLEDGLDVQCTLDTYLFDQPAQPSLDGGLPMAQRGLI